MSDFGIWRSSISLTMARHPSTGRGILRDEVKEIIDVIAEHDAVL
ncbi:hypothetical protein J2046_004059 [Rhizobium petrolearium]|nr:hypothetical protein [Neorhizobium petrolearium]MBP1845785.1 hypothetical protein [Neorhizobium petrolearium]